MEKSYALSITENEIDKKYDEIREHILNDKELSDVLSIKTKKDLLKVIEAFCGVSSLKNEDAFFKSEKHKLAFMIINHQGTFFDKELGIKKKHYLDKKMANEWKKKYQSIFHPDKNIDDNLLDYEMIMQKINKIYSRMLGKA
ncbi:hypothetical protein [Endozoicomonas euniceicola]|uniref:J domain-containing protein n=1 Tax=Endozoicomonas euniceicola TaxID=1234143 RepID=A0ABY6GZJ8_9GAMM|nr:hypothetical protein [Endozoicomonas euniceicola]UYM18233.1 hypothetical protein NX720_10120 [Endozoicomonas euniceicola]